jgi:hypothetical protein
VVCVGEKGGLLRQVGNVTWEEGSRTREILVPFLLLTKQEPLDWSFFATSSVLSFACK